jgi:hypothetical protein
MSHYSNSAAFQMNPTHCSCCHQPLVDATSIEHGMGPICRKNYYQDAPPLDKEDIEPLLAKVNKLSPSLASFKFRLQTLIQCLESRDAANLVNKALAVWRRDDKRTEDVILLLDILHAMGYVKMAARISELKAKIHIKVSEGFVAFDTPYNPSYVADIKKVSGRKWDKDQKVWQVPVAKKRAAWEVLQNHFPSQLASGPRGLFRV